MGLDITAYRQVAEAEGVEVDEDGYPADDVNYWKPHGIEWAEEYFPGRAGNLSDDKIYSVAERLDFSAGGYMAYNVWRDQLADLIGIPHAGSGHSAKGEPFGEIVYFADNEGVIGPEASAKLLSDFKAHHQQAKDYAERTGETSFLWLYEKWMETFELAADNGAVQFH